MNKLRSPAGTPASSKVEENTIWRFCTEGNIEKVKAIIGSIDINQHDEEGHTPLYLATSHEHVSLVNYLLANGASVSAENRQVKLF